MVTKEQLIAYLRANRLVSEDIFSLTEEDIELNLSLEDKIRLELSIELYDNYAVVSEEEDRHKEMIIFFNEDGAAAYVEDKLRDMDKEDLVNLVGYISDNYKGVLEEWKIRPEKIGDYEVATVGRAVMSTLKKTAKGIGNYRRGDVLTDVSSVSPGQLLVLDSIKYKSVDLIKVTQTFKDKFYAVFVNPENPVELRSKGDEEFAVYPTDLKQGEYYIALEPSPTSVVPEVDDASGTGEKTEVSPAPELEEKPEPEAKPEKGEAPEPVAEPEKEAVGASKTAAEEGRFVRKKVEDLTAMLDGVYLIGANNLGLSDKKDPVYIAVIHDGSGYTPGAYVSVGQGRGDQDVLEDAFDGMHTDLVEGMTEEERVSAEKDAKEAGMDLDDYVMEAADGLSFHLSFEDFRRFVDTEAGGRLDKELNGDLTDDIAALDEDENLEKEREAAGSEKMAATNVFDYHQLRILKDTVRNPLKGKFLGGPSAEESEKVLREKFGYTDAQIERLKTSAKKVAGGDLPDDPVDAYLVTALWSSTEMSDDPNADEPLDSNYDISDVAPDSRTKAERDCNTFLAKARALVAKIDPEYVLENDAHVCYDFWLTRNSHGAGFWDGDYPKEIGKALTDLSKEFGGCDAIIGDDGLIHLEGGKEVAASKKTAAEQKYKFRPEVAQGFTEVSVYVDDRRLEIGEPNYLRLTDDLEGTMEDLKAAYPGAAVTKEEIGERSYMLTVDTKKASKKTAIESPVRKQKDYGELPAKAEDRQKQIEGKISALDATPVKTASETSDARKKLADFMAEKGYKYDKMSAKTIGFYDLARGSAVFVTVRGLQVTSDTWAPMVQDIKAFGKQNGFIVDFAGIVKDGQPVVTVGSVNKISVRDIFKEKETTGKGVQNWGVSEAKYVPEDDAVEETTLSEHQSLEEAEKAFNDAADAGKSVYLWYNDTEYNVAILGETQAYRDERRKIKDASKKTLAIGGDDTAANVLNPPDKNPITVDEPTHTSYSRYAEDTKTVAESRDHCIKCGVSTPPMPEDASDEEMICDECYEKEEEEAAEPKYTLEFADEPSKDDMELFGSGPGEEDIVINEEEGGKHGRPYVAYYTGKPIAEAKELDGLADQLHDWMEKSQYWPNIWGGRERGDFVQYVLKKVGSVDNFEAEQEVMTSGDYAGAVGSHVSNIASLLANTETLASAPGGEGDDGAAYDLAENREFTGVDEDLVTATVEEYLNGKATSMASFEDFAGFMADVYGIKKLASVCLADAWYNDDPSPIVAFIKENAVQDLLG